MMTRDQAARQIRPTRDLFLSRFQEEASRENRAKRKDFVNRDEEKLGPGVGLQEPAWAVHEREFMHELVTKERAKLGRGPIPIREIARVEQLCLGHVDYAEKYTLYCAELVFQEELTPKQP